MDKEQNGTSNLSSSSTKEEDVRKIRMLWIGLGTYLLIMLNALRYAHRVPYQILIGGGLINMAIVLAIIVAMTRVYRRLRKGEVGPI